MVSKSKWPTILIVTLTLGLVFGPVFVPREISRWYLAAAHNAFRKKNSVLAEHYLKQAAAWDPSITKDGDYWVAQLPKFDLRNTDELLDLIERAVMTDMRWQVEALEAADKLSEELDFQHAVRALKIASLGQRPTTVQGLNQLAYIRAMAGIELDEALKDIDRAIAEAGPQPSLLDTKAWVLHGLKRNLEALGYMNQALEGMERDFAKARVPVPEPLKPDPAAAAGDSDSDDASLDFLEDPPDAMPAPSRQQELRLIRRRIGEAGYAMAVMRYHRMRILETLKHTQDAAQDRRWLVERGIPVTDELF